MPARAVLRDRTGLLPYFANRAQRSTPVDSDGRYEVATADLIRADIGVNGCTNGLHTATSTGPVGVVVWGLDSDSSYAYPAGGNAIALTDHVIPPG